MVEVVDRLPWTVLNYGRPTRLNHALDVYLSNPLATPIIQNWSPLDEYISDQLPLLIETDHTTDCLEANPRLVQHCFVLDTEASLRLFEHWMSHTELRDFSPKMTLNFFWKGLIDSLEFTQITILVKDFWTESLQKLKLRRNKARRRKYCSSTCLATYKRLDNAFKRLFERLNWNKQ